MIAELELARAEGVRLLRNPVVWIALVPSASWVIEDRTGEDASEGRLLVLIGFGLLIPGFVIMVHTVLAALRSRSSHTDELFGTVPVGLDRRSIAHGVSGLAGFAVALVVTGVVYAVIRPGPTIGRGSNYFEGAPIPRPNFAQLLQGPFALLAVISFTLAVVRWIPSWLVILPLAFAAVVQGVFLGFWFGEPTGAATWMWPMATGVVHGEWIGCGDLDAVCDLPVSGFDRATPWWHLAYLAAVSGFSVVVAVLRHRRDRAAWSAFAAALVLVLALGIAQALVADQYVAVGGP